MYKIYADDILIYDDTSSDPYLKVVSPKLTMEVNAAGSLSITIPPGNAGYDTISLMTTDISVTKDGEEIWFGRVLQEEKDFWNNRVLTCEGALAFLNDTTQGHGTYDVSGQPGIIFLLKAFLDEHNRHITDPNRRIYFEDSVDTVTVSYNGELDCETNYETTIECINKFILEKTNGYLFVRRKNTVAHGSALHVDYLKPDQMIRTNTQKIEFGKNLMDFTTSVDVSEFATVIVPLGKKSGEEGQEEYLTVEGVSQQTRAEISEGRDTKCANTRFVGFDDAITSYGWIERVVHFDDCDNADTLYSLAWEYLSGVQYESMELSLSALDLHYLSPEIMGVNLGDRIYVVSPPHGLGVGNSKPLAVLKLEIPMDQPQNTIFQLGSTVKVSLTSSTKKVNTELLEQISNVSLNKDEILEAAKANATAIMNQKTTGYITITSDEDYGTNELYISETIPVFNPNFKPYEPESESNKRYNAQNFWKWSMNGLGYTDNYGFDYKATITKDGSIVGERIAAGSIHGSKITAGTLSITTAKGEEALIIGLQARGFAPDAFEIGSIDPATGENEQSTSYARTIYKIYLSKGTEVKVDGYVYEIRRYSDNETVESGFEQSYNYPSEGKFVAPVNGYYRFVFTPTSTPISAQDLANMANSAKISGESATITAEQMDIFGMVTFNDLKGEGKPTTVIDGGLIKTHTILADSIDLYSGLTVKKGEEITFKIDSDGSVTIKGNITMDAGSTITWEAVDAPDNLAYVGEDQETIEDKDGNVIMNKVPGYIQKTHISSTDIQSPTIKTDDLIIIAEEVTAAAGTGGFTLKQGSEDGDTAFGIYYRYNQGWETHLYTGTHNIGNGLVSGSIVFDDYTRFTSAVDFENAVDINTASISTLTMLGNGNLSIGGRLRLLYESNPPLWGPLSRRPSTNLVAGQLYFQTD